MVTQSPHHLPTPTVRVSGLESNGYIQIFKDSTCDSAISARTHITPGDTTRDIQLNALGSDGQYRFYAKQSDALGNLSSCSTGSDPYLLDTVVNPPTLVRQTTSPNHIRTPVIRVNGLETHSQVQLFSESTCQTAASSLVSVGDANFMNITVNSLSEDKVHSFYAYQMDRAGNRSICSTSTVSYHLDTTVDTPQISLVGRSPSNSTTPSFRVGNLEMGGNVQLFSDQNCQASVSSQVSITAATQVIQVNAIGGGDNTYSFYAKQIDSVGNHSSCSTAANYQLDSSAALQIALVTLSPNNRVRPDFSFSGFNSGDRVHLFAQDNCSGSPIESITLGSSTQFSTMGDLTEDSYHFTFKEIGFNTCYDVVDGTYQLDLTAPQKPNVNSQSGSEGTSNRPLLRVSGTLEVGIKIQLFSDSSCDTAASAEVTVSHSSSMDLTADALTGGDGSYSFYAQQKDLAGNKSACSTHYASYILDTRAAPPHSVSLVTSSPNSELNPTVEVGGLESNGQVQLFSDASCATAVSALTNVGGGPSKRVQSNTLSGDRVHLFYAKQIDSLGNESPCSTAYGSYQLDTTAAMPTLSLVTTSPGSNRTPTLEVGNLESSGRVQLFSDASCATAVSALTNVGGGTSKRVQSNTLSIDGDHLFYAKQTDSLGNESSCTTTSVTYRLDTMATVPTLSLVTTSPGTILSPTIRVANLESLGTVQLFSDSSCATSASAPASVGSGHTKDLSADALSGRSGDYHYYAKHTDALGNEACSSQMVTYQLNIPGPSISSVAVDSGSYFTGDTLEVRVTFAQDVTVDTTGGTPRMALTLGTSTGYAVYTSRSVDLRTLVFNYSSIGISNKDNNGILMTSPLQLAGGAIQGVAYGNNALLNFTSPSNLNDIFINFEEEIASTQYGFAFLLRGGTVEVTGDSAYGGDLGGAASSVVSEVAQLFSNDHAFAALKDDGSLVTWGDGGAGGDSSAVSGQISSRVLYIFSTQRAFAAAKDTGSVITWGDSAAGGDSSGVSTQLARNVRRVFSTASAFAALKSDGSVVTWGDSDKGGNSSSADLSSDVTEIVATQGAFAALKGDNSVETWGDVALGGDSSPVSGDLSSGVSALYSSESAFAALKTNGSVITWGDSSAGGDSSSSSSDLARDISSIYASARAFAALKTNGSVVTWGDSGAGGESSAVQALLGSNVEYIFATESAFAALKTNGSVVSWGDESAGGDQSSVSTHLTSGVVDIVANKSAFAALKDDGSVVTWGEASAGGDSSSVSTEINSEVALLGSSSEAFAALKEDHTYKVWGNFTPAPPADSSTPAERLQAAQTLIGNRCISCHYGTHNTWSSYSTDNDWGAASSVTPGDADGSPLFQRVNGIGSIMPPSSATDSTPLTDAEKAVLRDWINGMSTSP